MENNMVTVSTLWSWGAQWSFRALFVIVLIILIGFFTKNTLKDKKILNKLRYEKLINDFFISLGILALFMWLEYTFRNFFLGYSSNHFYHYIDDFIYEFSIIYLTLYIYYIYAVRVMYKQENIKELNFWGTYIEALSGTSSTIQALNVRDYNLFSTPLGTRYFFEQLKTLDSKNSEITDGVKIIKQKVKCIRIIVLKAKNRDDLMDSIEIHGLVSSHGLCAAQRNFNAIYDIHILHNIDLFIAPEKEIKEEVRDKYPGILKCIQRMKIYKDLDRLIIDSTCYYPEEERDKLSFVEDAKMKPLVSRIINKYNSDEYNVKKIFQKLSARS